MAAEALEELDKREQGAKLDIQLNKEAIEKCHQEMKEGDELLQKKYDEIVDIDEKKKPEAAEAQESAEKAVLEYDITTDENNHFNFTSLPR